MIYAKSHFTVVTPSKWLYDRAKASPLMQGKKIKLIYNGIDEKVFKPTNKQEARAKLGLPQDKQILLFSANGGLKNQWKGGAYIEQMYERHKTNNNLLFLNLGGQSETKANWLNTSYITNREELALYYNSADLMIYPSLADNCPLVVIEALACGLPVITFNTGGIPELVEHGVTGYIAKYEDLEDFERGLQLWSNNKKLREEASFLARKTVLEKFTVDKMTEGYVRLYKHY